MTEDTVRVLIVDDAAFIRRTLRKILDSQSGVEVVGEAVDGRQAVERFNELRPDVVCLDVDMPEMDGVTALKYMMSTRPTPAVIVSSLTDRGDVPFETLRLGAVDFFPKPSSIAGELGRQIRHLIYVVRNGYRVRRENIRRIPVATAHGDDRSTTACRHLLAVAGSLGSVGGLIQLLSHLPADTAAGLSMVCKLPIRPQIATSFLDSVRNYLGWGASWVEESCTLRAGTVYFFPLHARVRFSAGEALVEEIGDEPAFDAFFTAAAEAFGKNSTPILLAGDQLEGVRGLENAWERGSRCFAQDEATALYRDWTPEVGSEIELFDLSRIAGSVRERLGAAAPAGGN
ncbi:MAG: response regulator [bacterium]|nr:response regulator [bacterium]